MNGPPPGRVVHVTTAHQPTDNRILRKECSSLAEAGIDVCLVAVAPRDSIVDGVPLIAIRRRRSRFSRMVLGPLDVWRVLRSIQPHLLHVHDPELIPIALLWRLSKGRKAVYDAHEDLPKQVMGKPYIRKPMRKVVARFAHVLESAADKHLDAIVAATPSIARNFRHAPVVLVQNFPWLRDFPSPDGIPQGPDIKVVYVGGVAHERGGVEMIQGIKASKHHPQLILAGPATEKMRQLMAEEAVCRLTYLGIQPVSAVPSIVAEGIAGLVLFHPLPNNLEAQPTKIFEYMAAGRPFIASNFDTWKNLLGDFNCGLFIDPLNVQALTDALDFLIEHPAAAQEMGRRGRRALETSFTFEDEAVRLIQTTRWLLGGDQLKPSPGPPSER